MRISEATIRSLVRRKLIEAVKKGEGGGASDQNLTVSIPPESSREEVESFLKNLDDGSKIYYDDRLFRTKRSNMFEGDSGGDAITPEDARRLSLIMLSSTYRLDEFEVYDSQNHKIAIDSVTGASIQGSSPRVGAGNEVDKKREELAKWLKEVSARPLKIGSKGPNVGLLQDLLKKALVKIANKAVDLPTTSVKDIKSLISSGKVIKPSSERPSSSELIDALAYSLDVDNDFGPMTKAAVIVVQQINEFDKPVQPDGIVGKITAGVLAKYAE